MPNSQMLKKGKNIMTPSDMCANLYEDSLSLFGHFYDGRKNVFTIPEKFFFQMYVKCTFFPWLDLQM